MSNVTKKAASLLSIFILSLILNSCYYETRIDFSELVRRINRQSEEYELLIEEAFFSDGEWFLFADTLGESDLLITAKENDDKLLTQVSVSVINNSEEGQTEIFRNFCRYAVCAFAENSDTEKIIADSGICTENVIFSEGAYFGENGRYATSFFTDGLGCTFVAEIKNLRE